MKARISEVAVERSRREGEQARRWARPWRVVCLLALASVAWTCRADVVEDILSHVPSSPHSYAGMLNKLASLQKSNRITITRIGRSAQGRDLLAVAVHDPATVFGQGARLFVIARQHGNETSGTEAALALLHHFATSQGELERNILQHLTIVCVPMANPDGAEAGRRRNSRDVDLNRDWASRSQPETAALEQAVRAWKPHAVMDLHELPQSAPKPAYEENFIETIGSGGGIPQAVSDHTVGTASELSKWLRAYGYRSNVYYDGPSQSRSLCHRWFGLYHSIPSFLVEVKTGPGRSLRSRTAVHVLSLLVVANHLAHTYGTTNPVLVASAPPAQTPIQRPAERPTTTGGPASVALRTDQELGESAGGPVEIEAVVGGAPSGRYVRFYVDGRLWLLSNSEPYRCSLEGGEFSEGEHRVQVEVLGDNGQVIAQAERIVRVDESMVAGE